MSTMLTSNQLRGMDYRSASLYGMPHLGCRYRYDDVDSHELLDGAFCACCGARATNAHHEPPKGKARSYLLETNWGNFVLKPALIALCGMGNVSGCHGKRHKHELEIRWEWDSDEIEEKWWDGYWLSHGYHEHSPRLFNLGKYVLSTNGREWEVRL